MTSRVLQIRAGPTIASRSTTLLLHRRLLEPRVRQTSSVEGIAVLVPIWVQLVMNVGTTYWTMQHLDGSEMLQFMGWANAILTIDPGAPDLPPDVAIICKLHIILGLTLFLITPFTRLVHIWSAPIWVFLRPGYQIVRSRHPLGKRRDIPTGTSLPAGGQTMAGQTSESGGSGA